MRSASSHAKASASVVVVIVGLATSPFVSAATSVAEFDQELLGATSLARILYSAPMASSMRKCVNNESTKGAERISARTRDVDKLETKSNQRKALARLTQETRELPYVSRANCMAAATLFAVRVNGEIRILPPQDRPSQGPIDAAKLGTTIDDLSDAGLRTMATELEKHPGKSGLYADSSFFNDLASGYARSIQLCFLTDDLTGIPPGVGEEQWRKSCQLAEATGLTASTQSPDFSRTRVVDDGSAKTPLSLNRAASQPSIDEYYPPTSTRLGEQGVVRVKVCVGLTGRVREAAVDETSGFERLDAAGVKVAKLYHFIPATENGSPVEACTTMPITFALK